MKNIAHQFPNTKFLAFTKRFDIQYRSLPDNLTVLASMWPKWGDPKIIDLPKAWMQDDLKTGFQIIVLNARVLVTPATSAGNWVKKVVIKMFY